MSRLPRSLHPMAWWIWALGCAVAASNTTNPIWLAGLLGVLIWVVNERRSNAPWASVFRFYLAGAALIVVFRVFFRVLLAGGKGEHVIVPLPEIHLPDLAAGITLLGDITLESVLAGFYDGLRLATMLVCLGAANALANPRRLLRSMPPALHEVATVVVVALSVFPQLGDSLVRVRRARQLRPTAGTGSGRGRRGRLGRFTAVIVPVLEDAFDRSLVLAASMDARGYGRVGDRTRRQSWVTGGFMVLGLAGLAIGAYALLDQRDTPLWIAAAVLALGVVAAGLGMWMSGRGTVRTTYRPDTWHVPEAVVAASGIACGALMITAAISQADVTAPSALALDLPRLSAITAAALVVAVIPAYAAPRPPRDDGGIR